MIPKYNFERERLKCNYSDVLGNRTFAKNLMFDMIILPCKAITKLILV